MLQAAGRARGTIIIHSKQAVEQMNFANFSKKNRSLDPLLVNPINIYYFWLNLGKFQCRKILFYKKGSDFFR